VSGVRIACDRETGDPKGFGHVEFADAASVDKAMEKCGSKLDGRNIRLDYSGAKTGGAGGGGRGGRGGDRGGRGGSRGGSRGRGAPRREVEHFAGTKISL